VRKPHFIYQLTSEAEELFPKSYDALFNALVTVLKETLPASEVNRVLKELGRRLVDNGATDGLQLRERAQKAADILERMGGAPRLVASGERLTIESSSCPIAAAVEVHPEACRVPESLIAEITGAKVREKCNRATSPPHCAFEITGKNR
jgi:predicted ArsR family transcriptional regulator